jgi:hypothetical protein
MPERPLVVVFLAAAAAVCLLLGIAFAIPEGTPTGYSASSGACPGGSLRAVCFFGFGLFCLCAIFLFRTGVVFPAG